jgi:NAD(P)H-hydrate epimerase
MSGTGLLSVVQMYAADQAAMSSGVSGTALMEAAGAGVAHEIALRWPVGRIAILCGPGNNGGDGFVAARYLQEVGWTVRLGLAGSKAGLTGDAAAMAELWPDVIEALSPAILDDADVIVDAFFGAGLSRPVEGKAAEILDAVQSSSAAVVAVDVPSGVHGDSGQVLGRAVPADLTVTFHRRKTGHVLLPGRVLCGEVAVIDIGIPGGLFEDDINLVRENEPDLWLAKLPRPGIDGHKYARGHAVVASGDAESCGASRLAARAALRVGAGLVTAVGPVEAMKLHAAYTAAVMTENCETPDVFDSLISQRRRNAVLIGPGNGVTPTTRDNVLSALKRNLACVLDADALTVFQDQPDDLFRAIGGPCVLTPHDGEFGRLFGPVGEAADKLRRTRDAARSSGAVVVSKGGDTVIAAPDGRAVINTNAPADLATAGSGDVLAGMIVGLLAQGVAPFEAACAAVWMHGEAARVVGPGLIADDLPDALMTVLNGLYPGNV